MIFLAVISSIFVFSNALDSISYTLFLIVGRQTNGLRSHICWYFAITHRTSHLRSIPFNSRKKMFLLDTSFHPYSPISNKENPYFFQPKKTPVRINFFGIRSINPLIKKPWLLCRIARMYILRGEKNPHLIFMFFFHQKFARLRLLIWFLYGLCHPSSGLSSKSHLRRRQTIGEHTPIAVVLFAQNSIRGKRLFFFSQTNLPMRGA